MSQGGSISERMKQAEKITDGLTQKCINAGMPAGPRSMYRMNDDEFQHHVATLVHEQLFRKLGISEEEYKLMIQETWNVELEKLYLSWKQYKADQLREQLTKGIVLRPDIET